MNTPTITNRKITGHLNGWGDLESWDEVSADGTVRHFEMYEAAPVPFMGMMIGGIALVREVEPCAT